jgi:hypothetical protein
MKSKSSEDLDPLLLTKDIDRISGYVLRHILIKADKIAFFEMIQLLKLALTKTPNDLHVNYEALRINTKNALFFGARQRDMLDLAYETVNDVIVSHIRKNGGMPEEGYNHEH